MASPARPRLLDLFCCAGGASMGYYRAGFDVVGVDHDEQPNYPFEFYGDDALAVLRILLFGDEWNGYRLEDFAAIHASPPCQSFSVMSKSWNGKAGEWPDLVAEVRELLERTGKPYVIENVMGAPLLSPVKLCGSMFGLAVERHRLFESNVPLTAPPCDHAAQALTWPDGFPALRTGRSDKRARVVGVFGTGGGPTKDLVTWKWAMGIGWMRTKHELAESLPPAYTHFIGQQLKAALA